MSRSAASGASPTTRTIGDILLERGFVTSEKLEEAVKRQEHSGKPLGQILVEEGAISRLELASALAEQWSDIGSVSPEFGLGTEPSELGAPLVAVVLDPAHGVCHSLLLHLLDRNAAGENQHHSN